MIFFFFPQKNCLRSGEKIILCQNAVCPASFHGPPTSRRKLHVQLHAFLVLPFSSSVLSDVLSITVLVRALLSHKTTRQDFSREVEVNSSADVRTRCRCKVNLPSVILLGRTIVLARWERFTFAPARHESDDYRGTILFRSRYSMSP